MGFSLLWQRQESVAAFETALRMARETALAAGTSGARQHRPGRGRADWRLAGGHAYHHCWNRFSQRETFFIATENEHA